MKDELVSFKVAKLAKEKGFIQNEFIKVYWEGRQEETPFSKALYYKELFEKDELNNEVCEQLKLCSAPTQSLLQRWLREEYGINISIWHNNLTNKYRPESSFDSLDDILDNYNEFKTYEEALEEGLYQALKLIKN